MICMGDLFEDLQTPLNGTVGTWMLKIMSNAMARTKAMDWTRISLDVYEFGFVERGVLR